MIEKHRSTKHFIASALLVGAIASAGAGAFEAGIRAMWGEDTTSQRLEQIFDSRIAEIEDMGLVIQEESIEPARENFVSENMLPPASNRAVVPIAGFLSGFIGNASASLSRPNKEPLFSEKIVTKLKTLVNRFKKEEKEII